MNECKSIDISIAKRENSSTEMCPNTKKEMEKIACIPYVNIVGSLI